MKNISIKSIFISILTLIAVYLSVYYYTKNKENDFIRYLKKYQGVEDVSQERLELFQKNNLAGYLMEKDIRLSVDEASAEAFVSIYLNFISESNTEVRNAKISLESGLQFNSESVKVNKIKSANLNSYDVRFELPLSEFKKSKIYLCGINGTRYLLYSDEERLSIDEIILKFEANPTLSVVKAFGSGY